MSFHEPIIRRHVHQHITYEVNGVRYERLEDVPEEFRTFFEDRDGNGLPDVVDQARDRGDAGRSLKKTVVHSEVRSFSGSLDDADVTLGMLLRDRSQPAKLVCARCQYDLSATPVESRCPECGMEVIATILELQRRATSSWRVDRGTLRSGLSGLRRLIVTIALFGVGIFIVVLATKCATL